MNQPTQPKKRPTGIVIIALLWSITSVVNIASGLMTISLNMGVYPYLYDPRMPEWFRYGIPIETILAFFVVAFGLLTLLVVYGLYTGGTWSYNFALALPVFIAMINFATMLLYASAPLQLGLREAVRDVLPFLAVNLVWLLGVWAYFAQPHVKQYLNKIPTPQSTPVPVFNVEPKTTYSEPTLSPPPPEPMAKSEEKKFCRHCGAQSKTDAVFCEKCGRKIG